jgi:uncharacterized cupin superfamily protein
MRRPIINLSEAPVFSDSHGKYFAYSLSQLAAGLGAKDIGANVTRVPPGKAAFPIHHHRANEEHFFILAGSGVLRFGQQNYDVRVNDYIVTPPGGPELAHQLINNGDEDLVYLAISTMIVPEVVGYPDTGKTGVRVSLSRDPESRFLVDEKHKNARSYWQDEDGAWVTAIVDGADRNGR